ncbi:MAG: hypothetical protein E6H52_15085 [Betaproteobacteria bacterium]|nr:MAG: hypothetical protein E6H52_15085 [Betaproteobacteria bacterium]
MRCYAVPLQMRAIASAGYRAIAPDMRGYGRSSARCDRRPIKFGPTLRLPFQEFCIGHRVLLQPTSGGALWTLPEAFIVRLPGRCQRGRSQITSLITSLNSGVPAFTVA